MMMMMMMMMESVPFKTLFNLSRRSYAVVATQNAEKTLKVANTARNVNAVSSAESNTSDQAIVEKKEVFWMRDPKTGNWIPETHIDEIDVCDLRAKLLSKSC